jgi:molybdenum cofactor biosynthesis enzyme
MTQDSPLTHFDATGQAHMVDVGAKQDDPPHRRGRRHHPHEAGRWR